MDSQNESNTNKPSEPIDDGVLNSWRRGFTPQAEIWNGRMAMFGLAVGLGLLVALNLFVIK